MSRGTLIGLLAFILCIAGAEGLARVAFKFPLYDADDEVGYWPRRDQQGSFLFVNDRAFDNNSLGVSADFQPTPTLDVLLVGDTIVYGGNEFRQADKLEPLLQRQTGWKVWPASAGS